MKRLFSGLISLVLALPVVLPGVAGAEPIEVRSRAISEFRIGRDERVFGSLTFVGGLELVSRNRLFGGFSALRFTTPGHRFVGVSDTGFWYFGALERDANGRPTAVADFSMEPITTKDGNTSRNREFVDAESLALVDGLATVGFERLHRISQYRLESGAMGAQIRNLDYLIPRKELRNNRSFETVLATPQSSTFAGSILAITEMSLNENGDIFAAVLSGPREGVFFVKRRDDFAITDGAFLPGGDVLLLERRFSYTAGVAMRLRRIAADGIRPGATVDGEILFTADMGYQIDNMEGLDVWQGSDGTTRVSLISDDNQSFLQRSVYLEFIYKPE